MHLVRAQGTVFVSACACAYASVVALAQNDDARASTSLKAAVGVDANAAVISTREQPLSDPFVAAFGRGIDAHVGALLPETALHFQPEVGYGYLELSPGSAHDWSMHRAYAGARLGFGEIVVPYLYGHVGRGWRASDYPVYVTDGASFDAGLGLDLKVWAVSVGGHVGYAQIDAKPQPPAWAVAGLDAQVAF